MATKKQPEKPKAAAPEGLEELDKVLDEIEGTDEKSTDAAPPPVKTKGKGAPLYRIAAQAIGRPADTVAHGGVEYDRNGVFGTLADLKLDEAGLAAIKADSRLTVERVDEDGATLIETLPDGRRRAVKA